MKRITIDLDLFEYDELSNEAKEKVKKWYLDDAMLGEEYKRSVLEDLNFHFPNSHLRFQYSLYRCQGDGVNTYGRLSLMDALSLFKEQYTEKEYRTLENYIQNTFPTVKIPVNDRYAYSLADSLDIRGVILDDLRSLRFRDINFVLIEDFHKKTVDWFKKFNQQAEDFGYKYLYVVEDELLSEIASEKEWFFKEDGSFHCL